ncbi:MAG: glycoside hydrolase family 9 protein [Cytophagaceae bacterium]
MKKILLLYFAIFGCCHLKAQSQTGYSDDFSSKDNWTQGTGYFFLATTEPELRVYATNVGQDYQNFSYSFSKLDLTDHPFLQMDIKAVSNLGVRIDFVDEDGNVTNATPVVVGVRSGSEFNTFYFDFTGKFNQTFPSNATVDIANIHRILVYFNPGGPGYTGTVTFTNLKIGSEVSLPPPAKEINLNQIGFYPSERKVAMVSSFDEEETFYIVSEDKSEILYEGDLEVEAFWDPANKMVRKLDFSDFTQEGTFYINIGSEYSNSFKIAEKIHVPLTKGLLKSYYLNRASMAIEAPWGGDYTRPKAHPDLEVEVHSSAASAQRPEGYIFASPRGWYDAGDFNKYIVNSGITTYSLLALYEHFPEMFDTLNTFIPESTNSLPDILDEALWNIRWMLTAQDPNDGGVYHKITDADFAPTVMPHEYSATRYAVAKSSPATFDFAAVMAQSYRVFKKFENELPGFADSCLNAAVYAYNWGVNNPDVRFSNPAGITTGQYGAGDPSDEYDWATCELYITTRDDNYYESRPVLSSTFNVPNWGTVNTLGLISLVNFRKQLNEKGYADTTLMKNRLVVLANQLRNHYINSPYDVVMGHQENDFRWGSNAVAGNQALVLLQAYRLTGEHLYLDAAIGNLDYVIGRNPIGYSYVTGFGQKTPMYPHHRISEATPSVTDPLPGMVVGGANRYPVANENCWGYISPNPAMRYNDSYCSYSSNEPAINYTAAVAYMAGGIEGILAGANYVPEYTVPEVIQTNIKNKTEGVSFEVFPNPAREEVSIVCQDAGHVIIRISDIKGRIVSEHSVNGDSFVKKIINISQLPGGIYFINVSGEKGASVKK